MDEEEDHLSDTQMVKPESEESSIPQKWKLLLYTLIIICLTIININNSKANDEKCFLWSFLAHLFPTEKDACRVGKYKEYLNQIK